MKTKNKNRSENKIMTYCYTRSNKPLRQNSLMKIFKITYSEDYDFLYEKTPTYEIEVEAENQSEAQDKAEDILCEKFNSENFDIWNVEEMKGVK